MILKPVIKITSIDEDANTLHVLHSFHKKAVKISERLRGNLPEIINLPLTSQWQGDY